MTDFGGTFWTALLGSNVTVALITGAIARKRDAGNQALEQVKMCLEDIKGLKAESAECRDRNQKLAEVVARTDLVLRLTLPELQRKAPGSVALLQARDILGEAFPLDLDTPDDMKATLEKMA